MRRTLWSLLVGAAAVFPAAQPALAEQAPVVPTVAPEAHRVEEPKQVQLDRRDQADDDPAPARAIVDATPSLADAATVVAFAVRPRAAPIAGRAIRLPEPRAP